MKKDSEKELIRRREYKKERARYLMAWEAPSLEFKARCYHAADLKKVSFNAWFSAFMFPAIEKVLDEQMVPKDPNFLFPTLSKSRPLERIWTDIMNGDQEAHPATVRRKNARRI